MLQYHSIPVWDMMRSDTAYAVDHMYSWIGLVHCALCTTIKVELSVPKCTQADCHCTMDSLWSVHCSQASFRTGMAISAQCTLEIQGGWLCVVRSPRSVRKEIGATKGGIYIGTVHTPYWRSTVSAHTPNRSGGILNPTLAGVPGNLFRLGKETVRPRFPALCYRALRFREFACNGALYD
jgi:hypothetical protein